MKKTLTLLTALCVCAAAILGGCSDNRRIDSTSLVRTVTVRGSSGGLDYTFYMFDNEADGVTVRADSLRSAVLLAENSYVPSLSLAKLELVLFNNADGALADDIKYMSQSGRLSPLVAVAEADGAAVNIFEDDKNAAERTENCIMLLKNNYGDVRITALEIFNSLFGKNQKEFNIAYVSANKELKAEKTKINPEK